MTWSYRVVFMDGQFGVHEVFYDEDGRPISYTEELVSPRADTEKEFFEEVERYMSDLKLPPLYVGEDGRLANKK